MSDSRLTSVQRRALLALAALEPAPALTGGGALAAFHLQHRETRDLDLFWHGTDSLGSALDDTRRLLRRAGLEPKVLLQKEGFAQLEARDGGELVAIDLVADPVAVAEPPERRELDGVSLWVDTRHEILVNKLCTLLSRSEPRDLIDAEALLLAGGDLPRALRDAWEKKDSGLSAATLAWLLSKSSAPERAVKAGFAREDVERALRFVLDALTLASAPP